LVIQLVIELTSTKGTPTTYDSVSDVMLLLCCCAAAAAAAAAASEAAAPALQLRLRLL
jgi:hypothetical protein